MPFLITLILGGLSVRAKGPYAAALLGRIAESSQCKQLGVIPAGLAGKVPVSKQKQGCGDRWVLVLNIARDWSAVVGQAAVLAAEITVLVFGCVCVCELSAVGSLGKRAESVPLVKQISVSH